MPRGQGQRPAPAIPDKLNLSARISHGSLVHAPRATPILTGHAGAAYRETECAGEPWSIFASTRSRVGKDAGKWGTGCCTGKLTMSGVETAGEGRSLESPEREWRHAWWILATPSGPGCTRAKPDPWEPDTKSRSAEGGCDWWVRVRAATRHRDGKGVHSRPASVRFAEPVSSQISMRPGGCWLSGLHHPKQRVSRRRCNGGEAMLSDSAEDIGAQMPTAAFCATEAYQGDGGSKLGKKTWDVSVIRLPPVRRLSLAGNLGIYITSLGPGWASWMRVTRAVSLLLVDLSI